MSALIFNEVGDTRRAGNGLQLGLLFSIIISAPSLKEKLSKKARGNEVRPVRTEHKLEVTKLRWKLADFVSGFLYESVLCAVLPSDEKELSAKRVSNSINRFLYCEYFDGPNQVVFEQVCDECSEVLLKAVDKEVNYLPSVEELIDALIEAKDEHSSTLHRIYYLKPSTSVSSLGRRWPSQSRRAHDFTTSKTRPCRCQRGRTMSVN